MIHGNVQNARILNRVAITAIVILITVILRATAVQMITILIKIPKNA